MTRPSGPQRPGTSRPLRRAAPLLSVDSIEVIYDEVILVLRGLSLSVPEGKIVALLGSNGAGKSTTLKAVSGLLPSEARRDLGRQDRPGRPGHHPDGRRSASRQGSRSAWRVAMSSST
ncbi:ATP-binding cassette domain-containing protein [Nocardioides sp. B-3]|uniref:ATP-binding cassette domain-containing protein n=1 Tax=Nocardioides sp. B-3 TaxID=2895565 RepID=UPI0021539142|nr:ATP-binding cassette domain-containing protein [Nocardioides sp. B-3]